MHKLQIVAKKVRSLMGRIPFEGNYNLAHKVTAKTPDARFKRLISHGYFAPELPPCFVSDNLAKFRQSVWREIQLVNSPKLKKFYTKTSWFNFPRFGRNDRRHGVINPIAYLAIAKIVADKFVQLRATARNRSGISSSPLMFDWTGTRAILRPSIDLLDDFRLDLASRREVFVIADIRAFYHSVYTHTIPWAIRGKANAKADKFSDHYANSLDLFCRNAQDQQTIGLPVGPDTSRVMGELIASAIDEKLREETGISFQDATRYVDDMTISSADGSSGDALIASARRAAAEYELELNHDKSAIVATAANLGTGWKQVARVHRPADPYNLDDFKRFFYEISRLACEEPDTNVEKWALQNARVAFLGTESKNWARLQSQLITAYRRNSTIVSLLVEILVERHQTKNDVDVESVRDFLKHRIPTLALEDRTGELIWFLFLMIALEIKLDAQCFERLYSLEEPMCALLVSLAANRGLVKGQIDPTVWNASLDSDGLEGAMWLYAYEGPRLGVIQNATTAHIEQHAYFSILHKKKIGFLSIDDGISAVSEGMTRRRVDNAHHARVRNRFAGLVGMQDWADLDLDEDLEDEDEDDWDY